MQTLTSMTDYLVTLTIPELRNRQEIVEDQLVEAYQLYKHARRVPDEAVERMKIYQDALMLAVDQVAFGDNQPQRN